MTCLMSKLGLMLVIALGLALILTSSVLATDSSQGAGVFKQWCSACHGDRGQGLTDEWRAEWPQGKQNCWQSKCHAVNHPPDGFTFPKNVPGVIGPDKLTKFDSAQTLYYYIRATMPYWSPNLLSDEEYRAITVFLVEANYAERGLPPPASLQQDLAAVPLHPVVEPAAAGPWFPVWIPLLFLPILAALATVVWRRRRSKPGAQPL